MQVKKPGYFHIFEVPANGARVSSSLAFHVYLLKEKEADFRPFGACGRRVAVKKVPKFAENMSVGAETGLEHFGFIDYHIEERAAKTTGYGPKQNARDAPGMGSYLDLCISHYLEKNGIEFVQTSVPSESRIYQIQSGGGDADKKMAISLYKQVMANRVRAKANKFMGRGVEAEAAV